MAIFTNRKKYHLAFLSPLYRTTSPYNYRLQLHGIIGSIGQLYHSDTVSDTDSDKDGEGINVLTIHQKTAGAFPIYETGGRRFLDACIHNTREPKTKLREYLNYTTRRDSVSRDSLSYLGGTY